MQGTIDVIFSNPPFAGYERDTEILERFELGKNNKGKTRGITKEVLFIEQIIKLLRDGGKAALVLPQGIYSNKHFKNVRAYIKKYCKITAIIQLPIWAFRPSGTGVRGSLLFLEKSGNIPEDYLIFIRHIKNIGYDSKGRVSKNEFPDVFIDFKRGRNKNDWIQFSELDKCMGYTDTGRIDARFFLKESRDKLAIFNNAPFPLKPLSEIAEFIRDIYNAKSKNNEAFRYIEINAINVKTGEITEELRKGKDITQGTQIIKTGDLIISRRWPDRGAIAIVPERLDGALLVTEASVLRFDNENLREYVFNLFRTRPVLDMMDVYTTGEMSHRISEDDLKSIKIPIPPPDVLDKLINERYNILNRAEEMEKEASRLRLKANMALTEPLGLESGLHISLDNEKVMYKRI